jgi:hypothetical protein
MATNNYRPTATQLYEVFRERYAKRKKLQATGAPFTELRDASKLEHEAWVAYVDAKRRATPRGEKFILPSRPL